MSESDDGGAADRLNAERKAAVDARKLRFYKAQERLRAASTERAKALEALKAAEAARDAAWTAYASAEEALELIDEEIYKQALAEAGPRPA